MPLLVRRFSSLQNVNLVLRGGVYASKTLDLDKGKLFGLHNLTITLTSPGAATVTFSDPNDEGLDLKAVAAAIAAQAAGVSAGFSREGTQFRLFLVESSPSSGVAISGGTALPVFGLPVTSGAVYNAPGGASPSLVSVGDNDGFFTLVTNEA